MGYCEYDSNDRPKKKMMAVTGRIKPETRSLVHGTSLASIESLSVPLVQEIVLSADIRCSECQKRIAEIMSRMSETESVVVHVVEKKVVVTRSRRYTNVVAKVPRSSLDKMALLRRIFKSPPK